MGCCTPPSKNEEVLNCFFNSLPICSTSPSEYIKDLADKKKKLNDNELVDYLQKKYFTPNESRFNNTHLLFNFYLKNKSQTLFIYLATLFLCKDIYYSFKESFLEIVINVFGLKNVFDKDMNCDESIINISVSFYIEMITSLAVEELSNTEIDNKDTIENDYRDYFTSANKSRFRKENITIKDNKVNLISFSCRLETFYITNVRNTIMDYKSNNVFDEREDSHKLTRVSKYKSII